MSIRFDETQHNKLNKDQVDKEERKNRYKSMSSNQRKALILKKMKALGIEVGSGVPNKKYDKSEVSELIYIAKCVP